MVYQRSREIESRLADLLRLIQTGRYSTRKLPAALGVSHPTASRCISALRERGYPIQAVGGPEGWAYELTAASASHSRAGGQRT
jgi:biotin operon repressor